MKTKRFVCIVLFAAWMLVQHGAHAANIAIVCDLDDQQSDVAMLERLETVLGHTLTLFDENEPQPVDLTGQDMVIITSPISSGNIGGAYRDVDIPLLYTERAISNEMNISGDGGDLPAGFLDVEILNNDHPITQGLPLDFVFFQTPDSTDELLFIAPDGADTNAPEMDILAVDIGNPDNIFLMAIDRGAELNDGQLSINRRVFYGIPNDGFFFMTEEAWMVFDQAIAWLLATEESPLALSRSISDRILTDLDQGVSVTVTLTPNQSPIDAEIVETAPQGWTVANLSTSAGSASSSNNTITWSLSGVSGEQTLTYTVTSPADAIAGFWSGGTTLGDIEIPVTGDSDVRVSQGGQPLLFQEVNGLLVIEAENFRTNTIDLVDNSYRWVLGSSGEVVSEPGIDFGSAGTDFSGDFVHANVRPRTDRDVPNDDLMAELGYRINLTTGGTYYLWARELDAAGGSSNTTFTNVDDLSRPDEFRIGSGEAVWLWDNGKGDAVVSYEIDPGVHDFYVWLSETGIAIDKWLFTTDANFVPTGLGPEESQSEMETSVVQWDLY